MAIAIVLIFIVIGSVVFHFWSPWWITPLASNWSEMDDTLMITFWVTGAVFIAINLFMAYVVIRFRHKEGRKAAYEPENKKLEWWLTILTTIGVVIMLAPGLIVYNDFVHAPEEASVIEVLGKQWQWAYRFPGNDKVLGNSEPRFVSVTNPFGLDPDDPNAQDDVVVASGELHLPINQPIQILLRSKDVLHDFYVPHFRAKMDAVPGVVSSFWFTPTRVGKFDSACAEYCGMGHYTMRSFVIVDEVDDFQKWLGAQPVFAQTAAKQAAVAGGESGKGFEVAQKQGCLGCHSVDGTAGAGPTWKGLFGKTETLEDGSTVVVDETYFREAIGTPNASVVKGFAPIMPPYQLSEEDLKALIEYARSLSESAPKSTGSAAGPVEAGRQIAEQQGCLGCHTVDGTPSSGPTWKGLFGRHEKLVDGKSVVVDDDFFRQSVRDPGAAVIEGYSPIMPPYQLTGDQLDALAAYARSLGSG